MFKILRSALALAKLAVELFSAFTLVLTQALATKQAWHEFQTA